MSKPATIEQFEAAYASAKSDEERQAIVRELLSATPATEASAAQTERGLEQLEAAYAAAKSDEERQAVVRETLSRF